MATRLTSSLPRTYHASANREGSQAQSLRSALDSGTTSVSLEYHPGSIGTRFYGRAKRRPLDGREAWEAEENGYLPFTYQSAKWFVFLYMPVLPLGTYIVMWKKTGLLSLKDPRHVIRRTQTDWTQILVHYLFFYVGIPVAVALVVFALFWLCD
jgi:hypothetical protein